MHVESERSEVLCPGWLWSQLKLFSELAGPGYKLDVSREFNVTLRRPYEATTFATWRTFDTGWTRDRYPRR